MKCKKILKTNPKTIQRIKATYASRFQIATILEIKCNSDIFLLEIYQGIANNLENKPKKYLQRILLKTNLRKFTTDNPL